MITDTTVELNKYHVILQTDDFESFKVIADRTGYLAKGEIISRSIGAFLIYGEHMHNVAVQDSTGEVFIHYYDLTFKKFREPIYHKDGVK
ncbi:hypothetical protein [Paenibacillus illinoisensis]|uniref:hypothetical protein n=1 Tax=Paenibacillus illinoisensis TaxID=59845 RepID=UPI003019E5C4